MGWVPLQTYSWEEYCKLVKSTGVSIESVQKTNFECWMRERAALNACMSIFDNVAGNLAGRHEEIRKYLQDLEKDQSDLSLEHQRDMFSGFPGHAHKMTD